jgi:hypothetical protein
LQQDAASIPTRTESTKEFSSTTPINNDAEGKETTTKGNTAINPLPPNSVEKEDVQLGKPVAASSKEGIAVPIDQEEEITTGGSPVESPPLEVVNSNQRLSTFAPEIETLTFEAKYAGEKNELVEVTPAATAYRRSKNSPFFAQIDAAYFGLQRKLENKDSLASDWANERANTEQLLEGLSADLSFGYRSRGGWQFRGGLGYTQLNTLFESTVTTQTVDTVQGLQLLIYGPGNSVDSIFGPVAYYETTTRAVQTYNSIRQWELPLLAGYNFELGRLTLLAEAGVRLQLSRSWEGRVFSPDLENNFQDLSATDWYRTGLGVSLQGGLQLAYPITSKLDVLVGGSIRYNLQDFSGDESPFRERYQLLGGQLSLRYRF